MQNSEKIKILKQNIIKLLKNSKNIDEHHLFIFAKRQRKEMQIEISKGELKSLITNMLVEFKQEELFDYDSSLKYEDFLDDLSPQNEFWPYNNRVFNDLL